MDRPILLFDGDCGFCTRTLGWLRLELRSQQGRAE